MALNMVPESPTKPSSFSSGQVCEYSDYSSPDEQSLTFDSFMIPEDDLELRVFEVDNLVVVFSSGLIQLMGRVSSQCQREWKWEEHYANSLIAALVRVQKDHGVGSPRFSMLFTSFNHSLVDQLAVALASLSNTNSLATRLASGW